MLAPVLFSLALALFGTGCAEPPANLLIISVDTLRSDHTSAYGYGRETTPRLARLVEQGVRFEVAYAPTASTGPSHATLFTGRYPVGHGVVKNGLVLPEQHETLAAHLLESGYQTAGIVSSFVLDPRFGLARGFEHYDARFIDSATRTNQIWEGHQVERFDRRASETTDTAVRFLRDQRDPKRPFFLFVHYFDPHAPYAPPQTHARRFDSPGKDDRHSRTIGDYDSEVAYTDLEIGRLLDELDGLELADRTLVVVTADHGEGLGDHGFSQHALYLYEEAVRVPLILRFPGAIEAGSTLAGPVEFIDIVPTVLDLLGLERFGVGLPGRTLAPALRGDERLDPSHPVFLQRRPYRNGSVDVDEGRVQVGGPKFAIRRGRWKFIAGRNRERELYDLQTDPGESHNLIQTKPEIVSELSRKLTAWRERHEGARAELSIREEDKRGLEALGYAE